MSRSLSRRTRNIVEKINGATKNNPLIFFSREAERALGLEELLTNYHIVCIEDNAIIDMLKSKGVSTFCLDRANNIDTNDPTFIGDIKGKILPDKSTKFLLKNKKTREWVNKISKDCSFYGMTLYPHQATKNLVAELGGRFLANDFVLTQKFENKIFAAKIFSRIGLRLPKQRVTALDSSLEKEKFPFVIQFEKGHTGNSTFFINSPEDLEQLIRDKAGSKVKLSELIEGIPFTLNCLVTDEGVAIGSLQYQITGIPVLTNSRGTTVGNDFSVASNLELQDRFIEDLVNQINVLSKYMRAEGYHGLFGIDLVMQDDLAYIIEVNARQTANIPFQTELELLQIDQPPLHLLNIAYLLGIDVSYDLKNYQHLHRLYGAQVFMRAFEDNTIIYNEYMSGSYRLQSGNVAKEFGTTEKFKDNVIFTDEDQDKPLIFYKTDYKLADFSTISNIAKTQNLNIAVEDKSNSGFILLFQKKGQVKKSTEELLRMKYNSSAMESDFNLKPWINEIFVSLRKEIAYEQK